MSNPPPIPNLRDIAGPPIRTLHTGIVLRSAAPPFTPPSPALTALNISTVFDLRSGQEIKHLSSSSNSITNDTSFPEAWPNGPKRIHAPVFEEEDYGPEAVALRFKDYANKDSAKGFSKAYLSILRAGGPAFGTILKHIASDEEGAVLVHCSAGKDRTGVICALILSLCDVPDEDIAAEYALSDEGLKDLKPGMLVKLAQMPAFKDDPEGREKMLSTKPESMLATLKSLREEYGSAEEYVIKVCGLSSEDVNRIRQKLLINPPAARSAL